MSIQEYFLEDGRYLPLHNYLANKSQSLECVQYLVKQWPESIKFPIFGPPQFFALHLACSKSVVLPTIIQYLADQWPEAIRIQTPSEDAPLHIACNTSGITTEVITRLVNMWPDSIKVRNEDGYLPLHIACCHNAQHASMIALIMDQWPPAVRDASPKSGRLPLHLACRAQGSLQVLRLLVNAWSEAVRVQDVNGFLPLHFACQNGTVMSDTGETRCFLGEIKLLVEAWPASLQSKTKRGMLPLHWACFDPMSSTDVIRYLVESYPAAVFMQDHRGRLPLHLACAEATGSPPLEAIQCLVRAWPESVNMLQGEDKSGSYDVKYARGDREDGSEIGKLTLDGLKVVALDVLCEADRSAHHQTQISLELLLLLTNGKPPWHFVSSYPWISFRWTTIQYLFRVYPNDRMQFHDGKLPFHNFCRSGVPLGILEGWLEELPDSISTRTTDTGDFPLHCYLLSKIQVSTAETDRSIIKRQNCAYSSAAVLHLAKKYPAAMRSTNRAGWLPLHLAAMNDAPLDVLFYLVREVPESVMRHVDMTMDNN